MNVDIELKEIILMQIFGQVYITFTLKHFCILGIWLQYIWTCIIETDSHIFVENCDFNSLELTWFVCVLLCVDTRFRLYLTSQTFPSFIQSLRAKRVILNSMLNIYTFKTASNSNKILKLWNLTLYGKNIRIEISALYVLYKISYVTMQWRLRDKFCSEIFNFQII